MSLQWKDSDVCWWPWPTVNNNGWVEFQKRSKRPGVLMQWIEKREAEAPPVRGAASCCSKSHLCSPAHQFYFCNTNFLAPCCICSLLLTICFTLRWCSTAVRLHVYLNFVFNQLNRSSNYISEYHTSSVPAIALLCWMVNLHCSHLMTSQVAIADCRHRLLGNCATSLGDLLKISPTAASSQCWSSTTVTQAPGSGRHNLIQVLSNVLSPIFYLFSDLWPACENVQGPLLSDLCGLDPHPVVGQPSVNLHQEWIGGASVRLVMMIKMAIAHEQR